jgi:hypothetical protein
MLRLMFENTEGATSRLRVFSREDLQIDVGMKALVEKNFPALSPSQLITHNS